MSAGSMSGAAAASAPGECPGTADRPAVDVAGLSAEQVSNARIIVAVGKALQVPPRGWQVAIATARQESGLRATLTEAQSDGDSAGLFQQRRGWAPGGSETWRLDPTNATTAFYTGGDGGQHGLLDIAGWQSMTIAQAAQAVQVSAFPDAYARWEGLAAELVRVLAGVAPQATCEAPAVGDGQWTMPLPAGTYEVGSRFLGGFRKDGGHSGQDFPAPTGTLILAAADGTVAKAGGGGAYGNLTVLDHGGGVSTWYAHQSAIAVTPYQRVQAGQTIGAVGETGNTTGPHLHFEVRINGDPIDPMPWLHAHGVNP